MIHLIVGSKPEDIEPIRTPRGHSWRTIKRPAERFPAARRPPAGPIPILMIHLIVGSKPEDVEPIRTQEATAGEFSKIPPSASQPSLDGPQLAPPQNL